MSAARRRGLQEGNTAHRARVECNAKPILVHLSGEDGFGWTMPAVGRETGRYAVAQERLQIDAARAAHESL